MGEVYRTAIQEQVLNKQNKNIQRLAMSLICQFDKP